MKIDNKAINEILVADNDLKSGAETSDVEGGGGEGEEGGEEGEEGEEG
jgi:hypothetical protein